MHARATTIDADKAAIDAGITHVREEILPELRQFEGFVGLSMMVERASGRCIVTTAWQDEAAMRASAGRVAPMRDRAAQILRGTPEVAEWEIAVMHRDQPTHDGACVRSAWLTIEPEKIDGLIDIFRTQSLPEVEGLEGFCSASFMVNRSTGRAVASVCCDSQASLDANRETANSIRSGATKQAQATVIEVREFELAVAHLRVPEMA